MLSFLSCNFLSCHICPINILAIQYMYVVTTQQLKVNTLPCTCTCTCKKLVVIFGTHRLRSGEHFSVAASKLAKHTIGHCSHIVIWVVKGGPKSLHQLSSDGLGGRRGEREREREVHLTNCVHACTHSTL